jgi:hypothetical protein
MYAAPMVGVRRKNMQKKNVKLTVKPLVVKTAIKAGS